MISVIIPVNNNEDSLHVCLNSVLNQTYQNFEVICIDDSSSDSSLDILEYFSKKDSRIKILKNESNRGKGYSRNKGLDIAQGDYVSFLDADDWLSFNAFEILINKSKSCNLDLLLFKKTIYYEETHIFELETNIDSKFIDKFENKIFNHFDFDKTQLFELNIKFWNPFCSKSFLDENNIRYMDENLIPVDIAFFYNIITSSGRTSLIGDCFYNSRKKQDSSSKFDMEHLFDIFKIYEFVVKMFLDNTQLYNYYKKYLLKFIFTNLHSRFDQVDKIFKKRFFREIQNIYKNFIKDYGLYHDIAENIDNESLRIFKFNEIVEKIKNPPKISIVVPVYNAENHLPHVLDSILGQTFDLDELEVIVVDDCSTDNSWEIICEYSNKFENYVPIHLFENSGSPSKPRNVGIKNANADYIIFQDSDDGFTEEACELLYQTISVEDVDIVTGMLRRNDSGEFETVYRPWDLIFNQNDETGKDQVPDSLISDKLFKFRWDSIDDNPLILQDYGLNSKIYKRSLFIQNNISFPEDLNGGEDSVVLFNCFIKAKGIVFINKVIYYYNTLIQDSLTQDLSLKTIKSRPKAYKLMHDIASFNNKKELFINIMLENKISYWFNEYLLKASLNKEDIISIFKNQQIIFNECVNYSLNLSEFIMDVCRDIYNNLFEEASDKIINYKLID